MNEEFNESVESGNETQPDIDNFRQESVNETVTEPNYGNPNYGNPNYGNPNYGSNNGQPYYGQPMPNQKNDTIGFGIASLVLGILTILLFCTCLSWITGILAIIFGIIQIVRSKEKGLAIGGIITGAIGLVLSIIIFVVLFINMTSVDSYQHIYDDVYNDIYNDFEYYEGL